MRSATRHIILGLFAIFGGTQIQAQCDFTIDPNPVCGSSPVVLSVINPDTSKEYNFRFGAVLPKADGETVTVYFPGASSQQTYTISLFDDNQLCQTSPPSRKTITVKAAPDATGLTDVTANSSKPFTYCSSTTASPEFHIKVENNSATKAQNTKYTINWGDGSPVESFGSNFDTTSHTYTSQGYFQIVFTVDAPSLECPSSTVVYSVFNGNIPAGGISSNGSTIGGCAPKSYEFNIENTTNNSDGTIYTVFLNGEEVSQYTHPPPSNIFVDFIEHSCGLRGPNGFANSHLLELEISNQCFNYKVPTSPIVLSSPPLANFKYDLNVCIGQPVTFINTTLGATINADGTCSLVKDPIWEITPDTGWTLISGCLSGGCDTIRVDFHSAGPWEIEAFLENPCGEDSITKIITLEPAPVADANARVSDPLGCAPIEVFFTNLSQATDPTYEWTVTPSGGSMFINGTSASSVNPEIRFTQPGSYLVSLAIPSGCGDGTWDTTILVKGAPRVTIDDIPDQCDVLLYTPTANVQTSNSPITAIDWQFPGGTPPSYNGLGTPPDVSYTATGTYIVTMSATNMCGTDTDRDTFTILAAGPPQIGADTIVCITSGFVKLKGNPSGGVWSGPGVVNDTFYTNIAGIGVHQIDYTITLGTCTNNAVKSIEVQNKPVASANDTLRICHNASPVVLTGGTPAGGRWTGPGVTNPGGNFDPSGLSPGYYTLRYIYASPQNGCADTAEMIAEVNPAPVFVVADTIDLCLNQDYLFAQFLDTNATIRSANWDFGDGTTSTDPNGLHSYSNPGYYQVTFSGITDKGCSATSSIWVYISPAPTLSFTKTPPGACFGTDITFVLTANLPATFLWDFGQGFTDTSRNPLPVFYGPGQYFDTVYYVSLTGYFECDTLVIKDSIRIRRSPVASFGTPTSTGCTPFTVTFFNNTTGSPDVYSWDFGNGNTSSSANPPPQTYINNGTDDTSYTITLIVSNNCGLDTLQKTVIVKPKDVTAALSADPVAGCPPLDVTFISYSTPGATVLWDFGDGQSAIGDTINYPYTVPGTYTVTLIARTACSVDSATRDIEVHPLPALAFDVSEENCRGKAVQFTNTSTGAAGYSWQFGDGFTSSLEHPSHIYSDAGPYTVLLSGQSTLGCRDTIEKDIAVYPQPVADFDVITDPTCAGTPIELDNLSQDADRYFWDFGNGTTSVDGFPEVTYDEPGIYTITLVASKNQFCFDTLVKPNAVDILPTPTAAFDYEMEVGIDAGTVTFTNLSTDATDYIWDFGDGDSSTATNPQHTYIYGGKKRVKLIAISPDGCMDSIEIIIDIKFGGEIFVPNAFAPIAGAFTDAGLFKPKGYGLRSYLVEVFSTFGELLWSSTLLDNGQPVEGWDGTFKGQLMPQDSYVWKITAVLKDGTSWEGHLDPDGKRRVMGIVMLLR